MVSTVLKTLVGCGKIRPLDQMFGDFLASQESQQKELVAMLGAFLSHRLGLQDTCVPIDEIGQPFAPLYVFPEKQQLLAGLAQASMVWDAMGESTDEVSSPIVIEQHRLYLQRYWRYEKQLCEYLLRRASQKNAIQQDLARMLLDELFQGSDNHEVDWQKVAVCVAAVNKLTFITGGPGTGKTTTVARLLALLQGLARGEDKVLDIQMVAPTGKAAARLSESMAQATARLPQDLQQDLPQQCSTIHRLLQSVPNSQRFRFNGQNLLHLDVLIIDEASMVDLPLMAKLFEAVPEHCQVILLGDKEQLASVEAGSVLSDISSSVLADSEVPLYSPELTEKINELAGIHIVPTSTGGATAISDNLVNLQKSHRFSADSGVGKLARAINQGQVAASFELMANDQITDINWYQDQQPQGLISRLLPIYKHYLAAVRAGNLQKAFQYLHTQQVLCAQKSGVWGTLALNHKIETELAFQGEIDVSREYYVGRPVMLSENDHALKLYNGDIGVVMTDQQNKGVTKVWFVEPDGSFRGVLPSRLPPHDTVFAMTIHKSQGSEFEQVHLCLGEYRGGDKVLGLSRELLYTGLTRAKKFFSLYAQKPSVDLCITSRCKRSSGLANRLSQI